MDTQRLRLYTWPDEKNIFTIIRVTSKSDVVEAAFIFPCVMEIDIILPFSIQILNYSFKFA